jgi:hypothetical protein
LFLPLEGNANDASGNDNNGVVSGAKLASGKFGQCYNFNGTSSYIEIPYSASTRPTYDMTLCAWASAANWQQTSNQRMISCYKTGGWYLGNTSTNIIFNVRCGTADYNCYISASSIAIGWHHIAAVKSGRYIYLYIDGIMVADNDMGDAKAISYAYNNSLMLGVAAGTGTSPDNVYFYNGLIDDVMIFNIALSSGNIRRIMMGLHPL